METQLKKNVRQNIDMLVNTSPSQRANHVTQIKFDLVLQDYIKKLYVHFGLLEVIVGFWSDSKASPSVELRLAILQTIHGIAFGGPPFLPPLHHSGAIQLVLSHLDPNNNSPSLVDEALATVHTLADAAARCVGDINITWLADAVLTKSKLNMFARLLAIPASADATKRLFSVVRLLVKLCNAERHQQALVDSPVLDALAANLASLAVAMGAVVPGAREWCYTIGLEQFIPPKACGMAHLGSVMQAIACLIGTSRYAGQKFLHSPYILAVFPRLPFEPSADVAGVFKAMVGSALMDPEHYASLTAMDYLLPPVPTQLPAGSLLTPLPITHGSDLLRSSELDRPIHTDERFDTECALVSWLTYLVREPPNDESLLGAAALIAALRKSRSLNDHRQGAISILVVPPLLRLIERMSNTKNVKVPPPLGRQPPQYRLFLELGPRVMANLVMGSLSLQNQAQVCRAVQVISQLLQASYKPLLESDCILDWSPVPHVNYTADGLPESRRLGEPGLTPELLHLQRVRASSLEAIAALCDVHEPNRVKLVEMGSVAHIIESLLHVPNRPVLKADRGAMNEPLCYIDTTKPTPPFGYNSDEVAAAACHAIRTLSRSVSLLRTTLYDNNVSAPLARLLHHRSAMVRAAATCTVINLVVDVSPLAKTLTKNGLVSVLCELACSNDHVLQLHALWALKHVMYVSTTAQKKACIEQLGAERILGFCCSHLEDQVIAAPEHSADVDMDDAALYEPERPEALADIDARLSALRRDERDPINIARANDLALQEQGLEFLRNMIADPPSNLGHATVSDSGEDQANGEQDLVEMLDYLLENIGQDRLFKMLASKLVRKVGVGDASQSLLSPHPRLVRAAIMLLVHIAGGPPRYRQKILNHQELLRSLSALFSNRDKDVRLALCMFAANITWRETVTTDSLAAKSRSVALEAVGFRAKLEKLEASDPDFEVRERAKSALAQMRHAIQLGTS